MGKLFDESAKAAVVQRYQHLAPLNIGHFPNPTEGDAVQSRSAKDTGPQAIGAGASYRNYHLYALRTAATIGQHQRIKRQGAARDRQLNDAFLFEAFGGHFLTDSFSAGHQMTERASIQQYWNAKIPDFFEKFRQWLADSLSLEARSYKNLTGSVARVATPQFITQAATLPRVDAALAGAPRINFGDLVSGALHDYFNLHGAQTTIGESWVELVGDGRLLTSGGDGFRLRHVQTRQQQATLLAAASAVKAGMG